MATKKQNKKQDAPLDYLSFETFNPGMYERREHVTEIVPHCFNGRVSVKKFRVTIQRIEEPKEVIAERIRKLWRECDNMHHTGPLQAAARAAGIELDWQEHGKDRKRE